MDPFEQRLRDEVIFLHSLWHQGPPRNPNSNPKNNPSRNLHPSNSTPFKKINTTRKKNKEIKRKPNNDNNTTTTSEFEWPCEDPLTETPLSTSGWPTLKPPPSATVTPASIEEQAKIIATQVQHKGLESCKDFFLRNLNSDSEIEEEDEDDDDFVEMDCEEYELFLKLFMEDSELRSYYEKNHESGEFYCLVCGGTGKKINKRFKNCVALVQHSTAISKTAKKRAHRAYGQVICKVLGWDINRLPNIVLSVAEPLSRSLPNSGHLQGESKENAGCNQDNLSIQEDSSVCRDSDLPDKSAGSSGVATGNLMGCENASKEGNGHINMEVFDKGISGLGANTEALRNCLVS